MYVTGTKSHPNSTEVHMFASTDPGLAKWLDYTALQLPGYGIFNTSICKASDKYVMAFEIDKPAAEAGTAFTMRFATSTDMRHWSVTPPDCVYSKDRYTASPRSATWTAGTTCSTWRRFARVTRTAAAAAVSASRRTWCARGTSFAGSLVR